MKDQLVLLSTEFGDMKIRLYDATPLHKENFLSLVRDGFYDGILFHRVINQFMIQGGDPNTLRRSDEDSRRNIQPIKTIPAEFNPALYHKKGAVAAARIGDNMNPRKESSGSQFYIVQGRPLMDDEIENAERYFGNEMSAQQAEDYRSIGGTPHLDGDYTVFGEVIDGLEVIDKIAAIPCNAGNFPHQNVVMTMKIIEK